MLAGPPEVPPLTLCAVTDFVEDFNLTPEQAAALLGVDRRSVRRWMRAEELGQELCPDGVRLLIGVYRRNPRDPLLMLVKWMQRVEICADTLPPLDGEEEWSVRQASMNGKAISGPFLTIRPLPEMNVGIKFFRARIRAILAHVEVAEGGVTDAKAAALITRYADVCDAYLHLTRKGGAEAGEA